MFLASLEQRAVAFILDSVLLLSFLALFFCIGGVQALLRSNSGSKDLSNSEVYTWIGIILSWFLLVPLYYIVLWRWKGQSIGMIATHIKVIRTDAEPVDLLTAVLRFAAYLVSLLPLFAGFIVAFFNEDRRTLHDLIANTVVIDLT
ncbi:MAG TPA: RDD family protein [Dehalococcoidia bacterium]|nr:RDD family protein [Dehalococcoidia bacterium]